MSEAQVLKILHEHPQVVVESVQAYQQKQQQEQQLVEAEALKKKIAALDLAKLVGNSPTTGASGQKVLLVEFSDFQCPFCRKAYATVKEFMAKHGREVTLVYKHLPLMDMHPQALPAAQAAWAAHQQGKFWAYHDALFATQGKLDEARYVEIAKSLKLDLKRFNQDRKSQASTAAIQSDLNIANQLEISGTPFFLLNRTPLSGVIPLKTMEQALSEAKSTLVKPESHAATAAARTAP